jgi:hypothetical protein
MIPRNKSSCDFLITTFAKFLLLLLKEKYLVSVNNGVIFIFFHSCFIHLHKQIFTAPVGGTVDKKVTMLKC